MANSIIEKKISGSKLDIYQNEINFKSIVDRDVLPSGDFYNKSFAIIDKQKNEWFSIYSFQKADGRNGTSLQTLRTINDNRLQNSIYFWIDSNGNRSIEVSDQAAWRAGINAVNKAGDNLTGTLVTQPGGPVTWIQGCAGTHAGIYVKKQTLNESQWIPGITIQTKSGGGWAIGNYDNENLVFTYGTKENIDADNNSTVQYTLTPTGNFSGKANGLYIYATNGYHTTATGSFIHNSNNSNDFFAIIPYSEQGYKIRLYWETGTIWSDGQIILFSTINGSTPAPTSDVWDRRFVIRDNENIDRAYISYTHHRTLGQGIQIETQRKINGTYYYNGINFFLNSSGVGTIVLNQASAWRSGLGLAGCFRRIRKSFGTITLNSTGHLYITPPTAPTGYTFFLANLYDTNNNNNNPHAALMVVHGGDYIVGVPNQTVTGLVVDYYYILTDLLTATSV